MIITTHTQILKVFWYYLIFILQICLSQPLECQFNDYENSLISTENPISIKSFEFFPNQSGKVVLALWSFQIPLQTFKSQPEIHQQFDQNKIDDGQLFFIVQQNQAINAAGYLSFDERNTRVIHNIVIKNQDNIVTKQFYYNSQQYEGKWILLLLIFDSQAQTVTIELTDQEKITESFEISSLEYELIIGGRGKILDELNLNLFNGRLSKPVILKELLQSEQLFEQIKLLCQIPDKIVGERTIYLVEGLQIFDGYYSSQGQIEQVGQRYCLSGWVKYDTSQIVKRSIFPFLRLTTFKNYNKQKYIGDEIFMMQAWIYSQRQYLTELVVMVDGYELPKQGLLQNVYNNGQLLIYDVNNNYLYEGLQNWHYFQYEYGRTNQGEKMQLQIQFFNELGLIKYNLRNEKSQTCFINTNFYWFLGADDFTTELLQAFLFNFKFEYNYQFNKEILTNVCHFSCLTCNGPYENNCESCLEGTNRVYLSELGLCQCQIGYFQIEEQQQCQEYKTEYSSTQKNQIDDEQIVNCQQGYFYFPTKEGIVICIKCPQQNKFDLLCIDCIQNSYSWYQNPYCTSDFINILQNQEGALQISNRSTLESDTYLVDQNSLILHSGVQKICASTDESCFELKESLYKLEHSIYVMCKQNYYFKDGDCVSTDYNCLSYNQDGQCQSCANYFFILHNQCVTCPAHCQRCHMEVPTQQIICDECEINYTILNDSCQKCGNYCGYCASFYHQSIQKSYLKCYRCIDDSKYLLSFDGINCIQNTISNCLYAFQIMNNNYKLNTLDLNFIPQSLNQNITTICGRCAQIFNFNLKTLSCEIGEFVNCDFGVTVYKSKTLRFLKEEVQNQAQEIFYQPSFQLTIELVDNDESTLPINDESEDQQTNNDRSTETTGTLIEDENQEDTIQESYCLIAMDQIDSEQVQFTTNCGTYVNECDTCIKGKIKGYWLCLVCNSGFYSEKISGKCFKCPEELNCLQCYQQQIKYQDNWKDQIRAFYSYQIENENEHPYLLYGISLDLNEYEIVCSMCQKGYELHQNQCILKCPETCLQCLLINGINQCVQCQEEQQGKRLSLINNECVQCPQNCALCRERSQDEINQINQHFQNLELVNYSYQCLQSFQDQTYYYDQEIGQFLLCQNETQSCQINFTIKLNLYCSAESFYNDMNSQKNESMVKKFQQTNILLDDLFSGQSFKYFEKPSFYEYASKEYVKTIIIQITSNEELNCELNENAIIQQVFSQKIFSSKNIELEMFFENLVNLRVKKQIQFFNFRNISIKNLNIIFTTSNSLITFNSIFPQVINLNNVTLTQLGNQPFQLNIIFNQIEILKVTNLFLESLNLENNNTSFLTVTKSLFLQVVQFENIFIYQSYIKNANLFNIYQNSFDLLVFDNLILKSNFLNSVVFYEQEITSQQINLINLFISGQLTNCNKFINLGSFSQSIINNLTVLNSQIFYGILIELNTNSIIKDLTFAFSQVFYNSVLVTNRLTNQSIEFEIEGLQFQQLSYQSKVQFIKLSQFQSIYSKLTIKKFEILSNSLNLTVQDDFLQLSSSSLCYFDMMTINIQNLLIQRSFGKIDLYIQNSYQSQILNGQIIQDDNSRFLGLHQYFDCVKKNLKSIYYIQSLLFYNIKNLSISGILISRVQTINQPIILIESSKTNQVVLNEFIILSDISVVESLRINFLSQNSCGLLELLSYQNSTLKLKNISFYENVMQQYYQLNSYKSNALLYVDCQNCLIELANSSFNRNIIINSTNSLTFFNTKSITIQNCLFQENNLFNYKILQPLLLWGFKTDDNITLENIVEIFPIFSQSNLEIEADSIVIKNSSFMFSKGSFGVGILISSQQNAEILLDHLSFQNLSTSFIQENESGGCIYIDGSESQTLIIYISNILANYIYSRYQGGFLFLNAKQSQLQINILNLTSFEVYSQQGSMLYIYLSPHAYNNQTIECNQILSQNSFEGYLEFLNHFSGLQLQEQNILQYFQTQIYVHSGNKIKILNGIFSKIYYESLFQIYQTIEIQIENIQARNIVLSSNLVLIDADLESQMNILLNNILIAQTKLGYEEFKEQCEIQTIMNNQQNFICLNQIVSAPKEIRKKNQLNLNQGFCNFNKLKETYLSSQEDFGIILILQLSSNDNLNIKNLQLVQIDCSTCQNGLISLQYLENGEEKKRKKIESLILESCNCGFSGCLNLFKIDSNRILQSNEVYILKESFDFEIYDYLCFNNTGQKGTCLYVNNLYTLLQNSVFYDNFASESGGAVYYQNNLNFVIENAMIFNNLAKIGGGAYFQVSQETNLIKQKTLIFNNNANYFGDDIAEIPCKLSIIMSENQQLSLNSFTEYINNSIQIDQVQISTAISNNYLKLPSGQKISQYQYFQVTQKQYRTINFGFRIIALTKQNQQVKNLQGSYCTIQSRLFIINDQYGENQKFTNNYTNFQIVNYDQTIEAYSLDDLIIYFDNNLDENNYLQLEFQCNSIKILVEDSVFPYKIVNSHNNYKLRLFIKTLDCQYGEYRNETSKSCFQCDSSLGQFSVKFNASFCEIMNEITTLSIKPALLELREGYWRPYFDTSDIAKCVNLEENCQGGWHEGDQSCYVGHIGALCEQCDIYNTRGDGQFSVAQQYSCASCVNRTQNITFIIIISFWTLFSIFISVSSTIKKIGETAKVINIKNIGLLTYHNDSKNQSAILIKMFTNYLQIGGFINTFQLKIPLQLYTSINSFGSPLEQIIYSFDCNIVNIFDFQIEYSRMIWELIMPFIYILLFFIFFMIGMKFQLLIYDTSVTTTTLIYLYIYFQPSIISSLVKLLSFKSISGYKWIFSNVAQRYDTQTHFDWSVRFFIPVLIIFAALIPLFFILSMISHKSELDSKYVRLHWGYLYLEYTKKAYFWEIIKILEKEAIIIFLTYYSDNIIIKATIMLIIISIYQELNLKFRPYQLRNLNDLDQYSAFLSIISVCLATGIYYSIEIGLEEIGFFYIILICFFNIHFIFQMSFKIALQYWQEQNNHYEEIFDKIRDKIKLRFPVLLKFKIFRKILQNRSQQKARIKKLYAKLKNFLISQAKNILTFKKSQSSEMKLIEQKNQNMIDSVPYSLRFSSTDREKINILPSSLQDLSKNYLIHSKNLSKFSKKQEKVETFLDQVDELDNKNCKTVQTARNLCLINCDTQKEI